MKLIDILNDRDIIIPALVKKDNVILLLQSLIGQNYVLAVSMTALTPEGYSGNSYVVFPKDSDGWETI